MSIELEKISLFHGIESEELKEMMSCAGAIKKSYRQGDYIFRNQEKPLYMFVVLSGRVTVSRDFSSGRQDILMSVGEGDVLGEIFFDRDHKEYWYDAVADVNMEALLLPFDFFYGFCGKACKKHQDIIKNMLEIFSERNYELSKKAHILSCNNLRERICLWLLDNCNEAGMVKLNMNREQLSAYLGVARPSLSRELMKMQDDEIIECEKNYIQIKNLEEVENFI